MLCWTDAGGETDRGGEIDYAATAASWVAAAPPRAGAADRLAVARRFIAAARLQGKRVTWFGVDRRFAAALGFSHVRLGAEPWWRAGRWAATLQQCRSLRNQLRRAANKGVVVRCATDRDLAEPAMHERLTRLLQRWAELHELPPMGFLCHLEPLRVHPGRSLWLAETSAALVGCAGVVRTAGRATIFTELVRDPAAPNGTTELLFDAVQKQALQTGHERISLGLAPLRSELPPLLRCVRTAMQHHYDFEGVGHFKAKLRPHSWRDQWLAHPAELPLWRALLDVGRAFAGGSLTGYAVRSALRSARRLALGRGVR